jgi:Ni/Co efflux regulator RcnB
MKRFILSVLGICSVTAVMAAAANAGPASDPGIHARVANQQERIRQGAHRRAHPGRGRKARSQGSKDQTG